MGMNTPTTKLVDFREGCKKDLLKFPKEARSDAGYQLDRIQRGLQPDDWKPMTTVGQGVKEIRVSEDNGIFRVFYVASIGDKVYVLHCFQKKTQQTAQKDIDLAKGRYKRLIQELQGNGPKK